MTDQIERRFQETLEYIYSFIDYSVERSYRYSPEVFELDRVLDLLGRMGDPQEQFSSFHVAGTKGKGSVCALLESCLRAAGYRMGLYTSPHLIRFNERIRVNGEEIGQHDVVELIDQMKPHIEAVPELTTYEIVTALGFAHFARQEVDYAVVEVGLGGRLDATNVITPVVAVITSLSYDHMHLLGESLSDIAREKAGIIKSGVPIILAPQQYEADRVVEEIAAERGAPLVRVSRDWHFSHGSRDLDGQILNVWPKDEQPLMDDYVESAGGEEWAPHRYHIPLLGYHQIINSATAYAALQVANDRGLDVPESAITQGFRDVSWPGRFQVLSEDPRVVVDCAHNRDSALRLRIALDDYFPGQPVTLIFGASADKDISGMMADLLPRVSRIIVTQADHPRATDPEELADTAHGYGLPVEMVVPVEAALEHAVRKAKPDEIILAAGSIFVAGEVLAAWERLQEEPVTSAEEEVK
jgi:dihydrofolate synthase/folylpolyglutamate synthase